ncbi:MAG: 50S ribosomal protein L28 [Magnetococcales bacterium]|nr:50S ribosomal protein L28 [Magnetococcales bacterium]
MSRKCLLGGKAPQTGYNVSHSHRRTKRQWLTNMQNKALYSVALGRPIYTAIPACELRTVDRMGGLDNYLLSQPEHELAAPLRRLQKLIRQRQVAQAVAS